MTSWLPALTGLAVDLSQRLSVDAILTLVVDRTAEILGTERTSVRLLDASGTRLVATCRYGAPVHVVPQSFALGEGLIGWIAQHAEPIRTGDADADPRFAPRREMSGRLGSFLGVPLVQGSSCMGVLSAVQPTTHYFTEEHEALSTLIAAIAAPHVALARLSRLDAIVTPVPDAPKRRIGESQIPGPPRTNDRPLSVGLACIDRFAEIRDAFGPAIATGLIERVTEMVASIVRQGDVVSPQQDGELLLLLSDCGEAAALRIANRAMATVAESRIGVGNVRVDATLSVGVAERRRGEERASLVARADDAMYQAIRAGGNHVRRAG